MISNNFFASIPYGPIINSILERVEYNLNLNNQRHIETDTFRDFPENSGEKTMMHTGPIAFTEAVYDKLRRCKNDCGEYVVMSWGVFADKE